MLMANAMFCAVRTFWGSIKLSVGFMQLAQIFGISRFYSGLGGDLHKVAQVLLHLSSDAWSDKTKVQIGLSR